MTCPLCGGPVVEVDTPWGVVLWCLWCGEVFDGPKEREEA